ncbi:MAG: hypothetical protein RLZZ381_2034 [Cyanobacteriota bacterium]|jgi:hypothetical protein
MLIHYINGRFKFLSNLNLGGFSIIVARDLHLTIFILVTRSFILSYDAILTDFTDIIYITGLAISI